MNIRTYSVCLALVCTVVLDGVAKDQNSRSPDLHVRREHLEKRFQAVMTALRSEDYFRLYSYMSSDVAVDEMSWRERGGVPSEVSHDL